MQLWVYSFINPLNFDVIDVYEQLSNEINKILKALILFFIFCIAYCGGSFHPYFI